LRSDAPIAHDETEWIDPEVPAHTKCEKMSP
jgi:hypothetical protein